MQFDLLDQYKVPSPPASFIASEQQPGPNWKPYKPILDKSKAIHHFISHHYGQHKLLLTEILFFSLYGAQNCNVIYAGAAPGDHNTFLSNLFPSYHFDLVDPARWNKEFVQTYSILGTLHEAPLSNETMMEHKYELSDKVTVWHGWFTEELAHMFGKKYANAPLLFLSDIRSINIEEEASDLEERYEIVQQEMKMQMDWFNIINSYRKHPAYGMFKFKAVFGMPFTTYLQGDLWYQPFSPLMSPELRLITNAREGDMVKYDNHWLEQHLQWFNYTLRNTSIKQTRSPLLHSIWDVQYMYDIYFTYLTKCAEPKDFAYSELANMFSPSDMAQTNITLRDQRDIATFKQMTEVQQLIYVLMKSMCKFQKDQSPDAKYCVYNNRYCFMAGYDKKPIGKINKMIAKNKKYMIHKMDDILIPAQPPSDIQFLPSIITNMGDLPLDMSGFEKLTTCSFSQFKDAICALRAYKQPLSKHAKIYMVQGKIVFVDMMGDMVDGKRFLMHKCIDAYVKEGVPFYSELVKVQREIGKDTLQDVLEHVDIIAKMIGCDGADEYVEPKATFLYGFQRNKKRFQELVEKITESKEESIQVEPIFEKLRKEGNYQDYTFLMALREAYVGLGLGRHIVESQYKVNALLDFLSKALSKQFDKLDRGDRVGIEVGMQWMKAMSRKHLDVGGGSGDFSHLLKQEIPSITTYTLDIERWATKEHKAKYEDVNYTFTESVKFPFADHTFDVITSIMTLHHIDDPMITLKEMMRVLKPGGFLFIREHACETLEDTIMINLEHMLYDMVVDGDMRAYYTFRAYYYSEQRMKAMLSDAGFVEVVSGRPGKNALTNAYYALWSKK